MKNIHRTTNEGLQRLVESYSPRISEYDVLDFLKKKGFDPSSQVTKNYADAVAEYLSYDPEESSLEDWYEGTKFNYPEDLEDLPRLDEALSDEAKANNEMIQRILNKKPSQLTAKEKKFLADNDLVRYSGTGGDYSPNIGKSGSKLNARIYKGSNFVTHHNRDSEHPYDRRNINDVDQLNLLKKRKDRSDKLMNRIHSKDELDILEPITIRGDSLLQDFNQTYQDNIKNSKYYADVAKHNLDSYLKTGSRWDANETQHNAKVSRMFKDRATRGLEQRPKFESLEDSDYQDFLHSLSEVVTKESKKWKDRGISISDVYNALDDLSVRYEDLSDEDLDEALNESFKNSNIRKSLKESDNDPLLISSNGNFILVNSSGVGINDTPWTGLEVISRKNARKHVVEVRLDSNSPKFEGDPVHFKYWPDSVSVTHGNRMTRDTLQDTKEYILVLQEAIDFSKMVSDFIKNNDEWNAEVSYNNKFGESLNFKTMPIPKKGSTFAFKATVDESEVSRLLQKKGFKVDKINDNGTLVWLIGHGDSDHIATYVPSTKTLYTSTRELFREAFSRKKR